tara:strand:+ start:3961 stop:5811 length:1851 start_codon:yes stop_codon:yes gene_type:complete
MAGFTGAINFKSNGFTKEQKNKLLKNFQAFNQTNEIIEKDNLFLCTYSKKNCSFSLRKNESLTLFYGRIDNLNELRKLLSVGKDHNYAEIIDNGLESIGDDFIKKIKGAFVFWSLDLKSKSFLAVKDHMGQKPLFYSYEDSILLFSTDIKQVADLRTSKLKLNKKRVLLFLTYLCGPVGQTFFENIFRLPARKKLYVSKKGFRDEYYFHFSNIDEIKPEHDAIKKFEKALEKAITTIQFKNKIGSKLSGGLDSSSISGLLLSKNPSDKVQLFSGVYDLDLKELNDVNEYEYIKSFEKHHRCNTSYVRFKKFEELNPFIYGLDDYEPNFIMSRYFDIKFLKEAKRKNIEKVFDGFDGDSIISYGTNYLLDLGKNLKLKELFIEKNLLESKGFIKKTHTLKFFYRYVIVPNAPRFLVNFINNLRGNKKTQLLNYNLFTKAVRRKYKFKDIRKEVGDLDSSYIHSQEVHRKVLEWPLWEHILDSVHQDSQKLDVEELHPFLNRDVMEIALRSAPTLKLNKGTTRYLLRESAKKVLPKEIYNRSTKSNLSPPIDKFFSIMKKNKDYLDLIIGVDSPIKGLVNRKKILQMYENDNNKDNQYLTCLINLALWMKKFNFKWHI